MAFSGMGSLGLGLGLMGIVLAFSTAGIGGSGGDGTAAPAALLVPPDSDPQPIVVAVQSPGRALDVALRRAGITPVALAAAGVGTSGLAGTLVGADGWLVEHQELLASADAECNAVRRERDALRRLVRSGLASPEEVAGLQQAQATLEAREAVQATSLQALFAAATGSLSGPQAATLAAIRANAARSAPVYYRVEERDAATWLRLRDALANERIAPRFEQEPDTELQAFLAAMHARQAVAQARSNHDALLAVVRASWDASLHGPN